MVDEIARGFREHAKEQFKYAQTHVLFYAVTMKRCIHPSRYRISFSDIRHPCPETSLYFPSEVII